MKLAIIMCCYNRRTQTEKCLKCLLKASEVIENMECTIYVCDDGSTDGTAQLIQNKFPEIELIRTEGNRYWCKSMYLAMKAAVLKNYDFYLMVNDDVDFKENVLLLMYQSYQRADRVCGIVGATYDASGCSYGGRTEEEKLLVPNGKLQQCLWANWNCFLIPDEVINRVGLIDSKYEHAYGDFDYSYRMAKQNIPIFVATEYIGGCLKNSIEGTYRDRSLDKMKRIKLLFSPKGLPVYSYMRYHIRTNRKGNIITYAAGYMSIIVYILLNREL